MATPLKKNSAVEDNKQETKMSTDEMMAMIQMLSEQVKMLTEQKNQKSISDTTKKESLVKEYIGVAKMDKPCTLIHLLECHPQLPTTIKVNNHEIRFTNFGERRLFRFADMQDITSRYRDWFDRGVFTLGEDCDEFKDDFGLKIMDIPMSPEKYSYIAELPIAEFKSIVRSLNEAQALILAKTWVQRYESKKPGYSNLEKIKVLNRKTKGFMKDFMADLLSDDDDEE